jgi:hypothetical protein
MDVGDLQPLDHAILVMLPDEGSMLGKFHHMGRQVKDIAEELNDEFVKSSTVNSRVRVLKMIGLAIDLRQGGGNVWQRTVAGKQLLVDLGLLPGPQPDLRSIDGGGDAA